jgi:hypothetical protein
MCDERLERPEQIDGGWRAASETRNHIASAALAMVGAPLGFLQLALRAPE